MKILKTILSILKHIFFLVLPSAFVFLAFWILDVSIYFELSCCIFYILTILIVIFYVKNSWGKYFILPISFILPPIAVYYILESPPSRFLPYIGTWATAIYYSAPFFIGSIICILIKTY